MNNATDKNSGKKSPARASVYVSPGGIEVWSVRSDVAPLIALSFMMEGGSTQDPEGKEGVTQMMARLLDEGAGPYSSDQFQEELASRAIEMSFSVGYDSFSGSLKTLASNADKAFELLRLALLEPHFEETSIERVKAQTIAGLRYQQNDPGFMSSRALTSEAFPGHAYGRPVSGTVESNTAITRADIIEAHARVVSKAQLKVAVVGAFDEAQLGRLLDHAFAELPAANRLISVSPITIMNRGKRIIRELDVPQSVVRFGYEGLAWTDPDFTASFILNHIYGGGSFTSRLFQEVREKRGLAYSVGTSLSNYRQTAVSWGYTATKNERVSECLDVIVEEMKRLKAEGPSANELQQAKDYLTGSYALGFDTSTKIAYQLVQIAFEGLGIDYLDRRNALVNTVSLEDINRVSERIFGDCKLLVAIAGKPEGL
ncbi:pitrilysin family protein [Microvirga sp. W0021]|uniref:Pitrilysin family protein n=1 Tax=Hohaiivirga grylli TaxID=3133970 RepID=A0ABV0BJN8_9HYPH